MVIIHNKYNTVRSRSVELGKLMNVNDGDCCAAVSMEFRVPAHQHTRSKERVW